MDKKISFIGAELGWGARRSGCEDGPSTLKLLNITSKIPNSGWANIVSAPSSARGQEKTYRESSSVNSFFQPAFGRLCL